jgi:hypothetical protein
MGGLISVIQSDSTINTLILEASGTYALYTLTEFISMARESMPSLGYKFEVEAMWSHGIIHRKHCVLLKGDNDILKMLVTVCNARKKQKYLKAWYTAICPDQHWDKQQEKWISERKY